MVVDFTLFIYFPIYLSSYLSIYLYKEYYGTDGVSGEKADSTLELEDSLVEVELSTGNKVDVYFYPSIFSSIYLSICISIYLLIN